MVIPTHNRPHWLATALRSAQAQSWAPLEIIVCDDGGLDATRDVALAQAGDTRVRLVRGEASGIAMNHRRALDAARGDFIAFLSDDDQMAPEFVARRMERLVGDPDAVVAFSGFRICDAEFNLVRTFAPALPSDLPLGDSELLSAALSHDWSINGSLYRSAAVRAAWPELAQVDAAFDFALHLRLALGIAARGWYVPSLDVDYRLHEAQATRGDARLRHFGVAARVYDEVLGHPMSRVQRSLIATDYANWQVQWARTMAEFGDLRGARARMRAAVRTAPSAMVAWRQLAIAYIAPRRLLPR